MAQSWIDPSLITKTSDADRGDATPSWVDSSRSTEAWVDPEAGQLPSPSPLLDRFRDLWETPEVREVADQAATKVEAFSAVRNAAEGAQLEADRFIQHLANTRAQLIDIAEGDPVMVPLALDLAATLIPPMVRGDGPEHAGPITSHVQSAVARAGIHAFALKDEGAARAALDRYGSYLNDDDRAGLTQFIDTMGLARATDQVASQAQALRDQQIASDSSAHDHLSRLTDPGTGDVRFPANWLESVVADRNITPATKAVLWRAHDTLMRDGDLLASNPMTVVGLLDAARVPGALTPTDVWKRAGVDLSLADAQMIAGAAFPKTPAQRREVEGFSATLSAARRILVSPEYGAAGPEAFGRFVNWLLPEYRRAGPGSLDPRSENWILGDPKSGASAIDSFIPRPGDMIAGPARPMSTGNTVDRPSLAEIFGRRK